MTTISLSLTQNQINEIYKIFSTTTNQSKPSYTQYQLKVENCTITAYESKKVLFQGVDALVYASKYQMDLKSEVVSTTNLKSVYHAGSDEVGTGDYFGPVCVCAAIVTENDTKLLKELNVMDSKLINDKIILQIAPTLIKHIQHSILILTNMKYNQIKVDNNLNQIKAKLHNQAYLNMVAKGYKLPSLCVVDQFAEKNLYFRYLKDEPNIYKNLHFETKAESKYPAVAVASIIARYYFLQTWEKMEIKYDMKLLKGASDKVDLNAVEFINKHGFDNLKDIAKMHFVNTDKVKELLKNID